jgi:hypothetical protein
MNKILDGASEKRKWLKGPPPLQGRIEYQGTGSSEYGIYVKDYFINDQGKVNYNKVYIGKVINKARGLYHNKKLGGCFTFSLENGFAIAEEPGALYSAIAEPEVSLEFGDVWMFDQLCKQLGLDKVLESVNPACGDTLKALVAHRLLNNDDACCLAQVWYEGSYARVLYPAARLESPRISEFHAYIGKDENYIKFFTHYLEIITKNKIINDKISVPILIDSTGLTNRIKTYLTAINNHHGKISEEMRLIYIVDKDSKLPIYFRAVPGNIIDNSTLITTLNVLESFGIKISLIIMDAGYCSEQNVVQLTNNNIPFLTRMTQNRKEYKILMNEHSIDMQRKEFLFRYNNRFLYGKKIPIKIFNNELFAYIMLDLNENNSDLNKCFSHYFDTGDGYDKLDDVMFKAGKFALLSSINCNVDEILPLYYTRQAIEQVFDIGKTYTGFLPLRGHTEETLKGIMLISFIATTLYSCLSNKLADSKYSPHGSMKILRNAHIKVQESRTLMNELTKQQKDIFSILNIECPFSILERGNLLQRSPLQSPGEKKKRGRPAGKPKEQKTASCEGNDAGSSLKGKRGRPKGSKNKPKFSNEGDETNPNYDTGVKRQRGRPKGSKNKPKFSNETDETNPNYDTGVKRRRGRPKGSKNKAR